MQSDPTQTDMELPSDGSDSATSDTIETRLMAEEHAWLYELLQSPQNRSPTFRFPDLISACVAIALAMPSGVNALFNYLGRQLVLRDPQTTRRREAMWRPQYEQLQTLQRSAANRHPHPKFQLDLLTTACVALCREADPSGESVLKRARLNMAERSCSHLDIPHN